MSAHGINLTLRVWRQKGPREPGKLVTYPLKDVSPDMSFLEMMDKLNEDLQSRGEVPVAFDSDCREGICGTCGVMINGQAHGPLKGTTCCQLHMRHFKDGDHLTIEPWRAKAFPILKDLIVDRTAFDTIIASGGFISVNAGSAPEANSILVAKDDADAAMDAAACIGCGACVAACKNASAMLFVSAKMSQMALLPQGQPERARRAVNMVVAMDAAGFGSCSNESECQAACPKEISVTNIARMNREFLRGSLG